MTVDLADKTLEELDALEALLIDEKSKALGAVARDADIKDGFMAFFELVFGFQVLNHQLGALDQILSDHKEKKKGTVIEEFRGAAKTTTFTVGWATYMLSRDPTKSWLLIQAGEDIASDNSQKVADIIAHSPGYKIAFPHIVPDPTKGWGTNGYEVKKTHNSYEDYQAGKSLSYEKWRDQNAGRIGPSFVAKGYKSAIIGKRPDGVIIDDINDENNTSSERELLKVKKILTGTIFPAANMAEWILVIGTPWTENDVIHYCLQTGQFGHMKIPVYKEVDDGKVYTWPEKFDEAQVEVEKDMAGDIEFARMFLLDLSKTKGLVLKREWLEPRFDHKAIKINWPAIIFIDYSSTEDPTKEKADHFALAVGQIHPDNRRIIISDGIYRRVTHLDAQRLAIAKILQYPVIYTVGVEAIFTGSEYRNVLAENQELIDNGIFPEACRGGPWQKKKGYRFEYILADAARRRIVQLSDIENELLTAIPVEWVGWQGNALADMGHDDALDTMFGVVHLAMQFLAHGTHYKEREYNNPTYPQKQKQSFSFRRQNG